MTRAAANPSATGSRSVWWLPLLAVLPLLAALVWWDAGRRERQALEDELATQRMRVARAATTARTRAELEARLATDPRPLRAASPTLAIAALQEAFRRMAGEAGVTLESTRLLAVEKKGHFHRLRLAALAVTDYAGLRRWLHALAVSRPLFVVERLDLHGRSEDGRIVAEIVVANPAIVQEDDAAARREREETP
ncbi:hypothetical protein HRbin40_02502 [bacterium HR40]|nr:hypothetical protein HRbin40_02502 [bacterium HR40]